MASTTISIRTDSEIKEQAQDILAQLGLDLTTAINLFLRQVIYTRSVAFNVSIAPQTKKAKLGGWEGKINVPDDFNAPLEDFKEYME
ncbi:MAG: type II toxin-antitoxin system RelB/DinJ family antitoxin [Eubacteriaceae bacterium]|nr:type II toxin-antitoxin system RelB/DinJ family antitoxin [Eubacteriaceae bacterium]